MEDSAKPYSGPILYENPPGFRSSRRAIILRCFCKTVLGLLIVAGVAAFVTWISIRPHKPRYYLNYGSISEFNITSDGRTLNSTFIFNITARNPNEKIQICYDRIEAFAAYGYRRIGWASLPAFVQGHKNTTFLNPILTAESVSLPPGVGSSLKREYSSGRLGLVVKLYAKIRFKVGRWKSNHFQLNVKCPRTILDVNGGSFNTQKCTVYF